MKKIIAILLWFGLTPSAQAQEFTLICEFRGGTPNSYRVDEGRRMVDGRKAFFSDSEISFMDTSDPKMFYLVTMDRYTRIIRITRQDPSQPVTILGECRKAENRAF